MPGGSAHDSTVSSYLSRASYRSSDQAKRDIMGALHHYPGLKPKMEKYNFNDGRSKDLICLEGTIPVPYRGSMYNIPVGIWLVETHPAHAPMCYVRPTADMQIKVSRNVDNNGKIYLPYLHEWDGNNSDILSLIQMCIITFGEQPPVFARAQPPPAPAPPVLNQAYPPPYPTQNASFGGFPGYPAQAQAGGYPPVPTPAYPNPQPPQPPNPTQAYPPAYPNPVNPTQQSSLQNSGTITQDHLLMSLRSAVEDMVRRKLREEYAMKNVEIQSLTKIRDELQGGQAKLKQALQALDQETLNMEASIRELNQENTKMQETLVQAERMKEATDMKPEDAIITPTPLHRQLLNAHAEEAAVHEAIYYLGEALKHEVIDCDVFLKQVRKMARKQFFLKATMIKCRQKAGLPA